MILSQVPEQTRTPERAHKPPEGTGSLRKGPKGTGRDRKRQALKPGEGTKPAIPGEVGFRAKKSYLGVAQLVARYLGVVGNAVDYQACIRHKIAIGNCSRGRTDEQPCRSSGRYHVSTGIAVGYRTACVCTAADKTAHRTTGRRRDVSGGVTARNICAVVYACKTADISTVVRIDIHRRITVINRTTRTVISNKSPDIYRLY